MESFSMPTRPSATSAPARTSHRSQLACDMHPAWFREGLKPGAVCYILVACISVQTCASLVAATKIIHEVLCLVCTSL